MTLSESKATTLQSKLSKLELKVDLFSRDTPLPGLASLTVFTAFQISEISLVPVGLGCVERAVGGLARKGRRRGSKELVACDQSR